MSVLLKNVGHKTDLQVTIETGWVRVGGIKLKDEKGFSRSNKSKISLRTQFFL